MNKTSIRALAGLATVLIGISNTNLHAATFSDDNWSSMGGYPGANDPVYATGVDGAGNLYIGGYFTVVGDVPANSIAKWNGTNWSALGSGLQGSNGWAVVYALAVSGNDLYVAGDFTMAGGVAARNIAKWNGTNWSALGTGVDSYVNALAVSGSDLYVGGWFTNAGGITVNRIAQWDGSSWSALGSGVGRTDSYNPGVNALAVSGNNLYAGGWFTTADGVAATNIAKWNGNRWSALGSGLNAGVRTLAASGRDVYATGIYSGLGGPDVAKWDGNSWSALPTEVGSSEGLPRTFTVSGGDLYAGGNLLTWIVPGVEFTYRAYVAKWNGSTWLELGSGIDSEWGEAWDPDVRTLAVSGTNVYAGGAFRQAGAVTAYCIAKWNGSKWSTLSSSGNSYVAVMTASGRDVYGAGVFAAADGSGSNSIAKWNGTHWSALGSEFQGYNPFPFLGAALAVSGSDLYVGGAFTNAGGTPANRIARWNGSSWIALGSGINNGGVTALAVLGNDLYAGGRFTSAGDIAANNIAKWDGTHWSALGSGMNNHVFALAASGNDLYAGGAFTTAGGSSANYIARWDGSSWSALGSGMGGSPGFVNALAVLGSDLYAGGGFTTAGGITVQCVAKWDGSSWSALSSGMTANNWTPGGEYNTTPYVFALAASGSDLYVGGEFTTAGDIAANFIAKWNGSSWSAVGSGMNYSVWRLAASSDELFAAGSFTMAGGKLSPYLTRARIGSIARSVVRTNSTATIQFSGVTGYQYDVQRTTNFTPPVAWTTVTTIPVSPAPNGSFTFTDANAPPNTAFYRAVER